MKPQKTFRTPSLGLLALLGLPLIIQAQSSGTTGASGSSGATGTNGTSASSGSTSSSTGTSESSRTGQTTGPSNTSTPSDDTVTNTSPTQSLTPTQPGSPHQPGTPVEPGVPRQPGTPIQPGQPGYPGTPAQPTQPEIPGQPARPSRPDQPNQPSLRKPGELDPRTPRDSNGIDHTPNAGVESATIIRGLSDSNYTNREQSLGLAARASSAGVHFASSIETDSTKLSGPARAKVKKAITRADVARNELDQSISRARTATEPNWQKARAEVIKNYQAYSESLAQARAVALESGVGIKTTPADGTGKRQDQSR